MSTPFIGEVKIVSFSFAPRGWAQCNGQLLPIPQNQVLFALLGTTYGGDGQQTFGLPNLQGRTPIYKSSSITQGTMAGEENHLLTIAEMPQHSHAANASTSPANTGHPNGNILAAASSMYSTSTSVLTPLQPNTVGNIGGQAHNNLQPYVVLNFVIALTGIFPSRS